MLYSALRPLLFALSPETAHRVTLEALDAAAAAGLKSFYTPSPGATLPVSVMGLEFPNRVGLAAGLDKNGAHIDGLASLGFGFIEVGTVTPRAQRGNPQPRLFRLPHAAALINRMGFNNDGVDALLANVAKSRWRGILGVNIGKNFDTPLERAADDYLACLNRCMRSRATSPSIFPRPIPRACAACSKAANSIPCSMR
jgi:dihydroorotate dehydrogenase